MSNSTNNDMTSTNGGFTQYGSIPSSEEDVKNTGKQENPNRDVAILKGRQPTANNLSVMKNLNNFCKNLFKSLQEDSSPQGLKSFFKKAIADIGKKLFSGADSKKNNKTVAQRTETVYGAVPSLESHKQSKTEQPGQLPIKGELLSEFERMVQNSPTPHPSTSRSSRPVEEAFTTIRNKAAIAGRSGSYTMDDFKNEIRVFAKFLTSEQKNEVLQKLIQANVDQAKLNLVDVILKSETNSSKPVGQNMPSETKTEPSTPPPSTSRSSRPVEEAFTTIRNKAAIAGKSDSYTMDAFKNEVRVFAKFLTDEQKNEVLLKLAQANVDQAKLKLVDVILKSETTSTSRYGSAPVVQNTSSQTKATNDLEFPNIQKPDTTTYEGALIAMHLKLTNAIHNSENYTIDDLRNDLVNLTGHFTVEQRNEALAELLKFQMLTSDMRVALYDILETKVAEQRKASIDVVQHSPSQAKIDSTTNSSTSQASRTVEEAFIAISKKLYDISHQPKGHVLDEEKFKQDINNIVQQFTDQEKRELYDLLKNYPHASMTSILFFQEILLGKK